MSDRIHLTILHTNDLHGRVHQLTRIAALVRSIRKEVTDSGGFCLYLDAGDSEDSTLLESVLTRGTTMNALLKSAGCDQVTLGNAISIRYGPQAVENLALFYGKPLLGANLFTADGQLLPGLTPYQHLQLGGLSLAIIGFTAPMSVYSVFFNHKVLEPKDLMPDLIARVQSEGAKTILALNHIGSKQDIELAETVEGIDVIIGGHDHKRITPPLKVGETLIAQSGEYGQNLGRLDLVIDRVTGKVLEYSGELIPILEEMPEDAQVLETVVAEKKRVDKMMNLIIGETLEPLTISADSECSAGNLQADAVFEHMQGAQMAFMVNGHWTCGLDAGIITQGQLYAANRSAGNPTLIRLSGSQIKQFLVAALNPENMARQPHALRGTCVGMPGVSGISVVVDREHLEELRVLYNDIPMKDEETFLVATTDLEISEILGYLVIPENEVQYEVPTVLPEIIEEYIRKHSPVKPVKMGRIVFR